MISMGSREGGFSNRRDVLMEDVEIEEGEACSDDPKIDPDVALSYIGEKLQNVLGHFQKDFEGLVSADSLGPKNGEYGTFLPAYRRSPVSHPKSPSRVQSRHTPHPASNLPAEGRNHNSLATSNVSHLVKRGSATAHPASSTACHPLPQNVQIPRTQSIQEGLPPKSENRDQRTLKVRIKVGSDNLSVKKNTAIYSGLGLDGSPSSSFDDGLKESQGLSRRQANDSLESPTQILQMMTSFPLFGGCVLSPLTDDLLHISEKPKYLPNIPARPSSKVSQHRSNSDKDNKALSEETTIPFVHKEGFSLQNKGDQNDSQVGFNFPLKDSDVDVTSCEEIIFNALKLPLLSDSYGKRKEDIYSEGVKSLTEKSNGVVKVEGNVIEANETMAHKSSRFEDGIVSGKEKSPSSGRKKTKKGRVRGSTGKLVAESAKDELKDGKNFDTKFPSLKSEGGKLSSEKDVKKLKDTYSDFFGNLSDHEGETMNSPPTLSKERLSKERLKTSEVVEKATLAFENISMEKTRSVRARGDTTSEMKNSGKSRGKTASGTPIIGHSENAFLPENGQPTSDQAVVGADPELWAECDECKKWRLLPPGTKGNELPDKWRCSLQTWLPNLNRCGISEEEGIKIVRARYNMLPEIPNSLDDPIDKLATGTIPVDVLHPIVSSDEKLRKISKSPFQGSLNGPSSSFKMKHQSSKVRTLANSKDHQLANAQQTKSGDMFLETNKCKTSKQLQPDFHSDGDNCKSSKIKGRRESKQEISKTSKRSKTRSLQSGDSNRATPLHQGNEMFDVGSGSGVVANTAGKDQMTNLEFNSFGNPKDETGSKRLKQELNTVLAPKKRKRDGLKDPPNSTPSSGKRMNDAEQFRNKRHRISKSEAKEASTSKRNGKTDRKSRSTSQKSTDQNQSLKKDSSIANLAATSSSSKVTVSLKVKYKGQDMKGSPVESVSSSPLRSAIPRKLTPGCKGTMVKNAVLQGKPDEGVRHQNGDGGDNGLDVDNRGPPTAWPSTRCVNERSEGEGKTEAICSRDKNQTSKFSLEKGEVPNNMEVCDDREEDIKNRVQDNFDFNVNKCGQDTVRNQESVVPEKRSSKMFDVEKPEPSKPMSTKEKSQCLPPSDGKKNATPNAAQLFQGNNTGVSCSDEPQVNKKTNSQIGIHNGLSKHSLSNGHKIKINEAPSPHKRDSFSQAASTAIKEAKSLKHLADRLKNADSMESTGLYFEAALKFLHGASLLEGKTESAKQGDIVQAMQIYSDTAKLCRFCAHEYEKSKDMATAALAYKCMEVAYLKVVYSSHNTASRDRSELQTVLQMVPPGESPSSSASDIDNLNNTAIGDKATQARSVDSPLPVGNLVIAARNRPNFSRLLSFAQDVNSAMEASRKSHIAFGAASASMGNIITMDGITSIKKALDFNFHDVEGLLRLVRLAKEATSR